MKFIPIVTTNLCCKGCGKIAKYQNKKGIYYCEDSTNKCEAIKEKQREGLNSARKKGFQGYGGGWNKGLTKETDERVANNARRVKESNPRRGHSQSTATRKLLSNIAKEMKLGGHTSKKQIWYKGIFLQSSYELRMAQLLDELGIQWSRPEPFEWLDFNNESHRYYPDFKVGDIFLDTKNSYLAKIDKPKINTVMKQNNIRIEIIEDHQINEAYLNSLGIYAGLPEWSNGVVL